MIGLGAGVWELKDGKVAWRTENPYRRFFILRHLLYSNGNHDEQQDEEAGHDAPTSSPRHSADL